MMKLPLHKMSRAEKVRVMEELWQDLCREEEPLESSAWHKDELAKTEQRISSGKEAFVDWEDAKKQLQKQSRVFSIEKQPCQLNTQLVRNSFSLYSSYRQQSCL